MVDGSAIPEEVDAVNIRPAVGAMAEACLVVITLSDIWNNGRFRNGFFRNGGFRNGHFRNDRFRNAGRRISRDPGPGFTRVVGWGRRRGFVKKSFRNCQGPAAVEGLPASALHPAVNRFDEEGWRDWDAFSRWILFVATAIVVVVVVVVRT